MQEEKTTLTKRQGTLEVFTLGIIDYHSYLKLQDRLVFDLSGREDDQSLLFLCEHAPTITFGRNSPAESLNRTPEELQNLNITTQSVARGGITIPHLPGQLSISLLCPLDKLGLNPIKHLQLLIECTLQTLSQFKIEAKYEESQGVFSIQQAIIGYLGSRVRFGISSFGVYLNVNPWLEFFRLVKVPADFQQVTSINRELMKHIESAKVREHYIQLIGQKLGYERVHIYTRHPLLERTIRKQEVHVPY